MAEQKEFKINYDYTEDVDPVKISEKIKMGLGHGTNAVSAIGNCQIEILDYNLLKANDLVETDTNSEFRSIKIEGSSYQKVTEQVNNEFGLGVKGQVKKVSFDSTLSVTTSNAMENTDNYEYGIRILLSKVLGAKVKPCNDLKSYILPNAACDINGKSSSNGTPTNFPTTDVGIKRLFDKYGTHIITKAIFGTKYQYYYMRESTDRSTSVMTQVDCNLSVKYGNDKGGLKNLGINPSNNYGESYTDCQKSAYGIEREYWAGGVASDSITERQASCNFNIPTTIGFIGYVFSSSEVDNGLIPLWEMVDDPQRAMKMEQVYYDYVKEHTPKLKKGRKIIVDVYAKYFKDKNAPTSLFMEDYTGKMRKFTKLDENMTGHISAVTKGYLYFFYALGYSGEGGLLELKFVHEDDPDSSVWILRGDNANEGVKANVSNNVIAIKVAPMKNGEVSVNDNELVTGFGLKISGKVSKVSLGTTPNSHWVANGKEWYHGMCHDEVLCLYTKDTLNEY